MKILGLGSSGPQALDHLRRAVRALRSSPGLEVRAVSSIYISDAMLPEGAPESWVCEYRNLALEIEVCGSDPFVWMERFQNLERELGRQPRERWAPRVIDIDLLLWDALCLEEPRLRVPHEGLLKRPFALGPLAELAPQALIPGQPLTAAELVRTQWPEPRNWPFRTRRSRESLTEIVGILNLTPDSFSDGGSCASAELLDARARTLLAAGISFLDLGGESTRPGAAAVSAREEIARLQSAEPVLASLKREFPSLRLSLDTRKAEVAARVFESGLWDAVNDVEAFQEPAWLPFLKSGTFMCVAMHSLGVPPSADRRLSEELAASDQVLAWGHDLIRRWREAGIDGSRLVLDPGLGFGKSIAQNYALLRDARRFHEWKTPVFWGASRKSFLAELSGHPASERDLESALISAFLARNGADYLRVHDADASARALRLSQELGGGSA